ncbi:MAG: CoA-binding protein [Chloroflexi bacterium]|nr:CoA-binding protein [Chloroflexota bacterium]
MEHLKEKLDRMFHPKVVAVVGAKKDSEYRWLVSQALEEGKVYAVNIDESEWPGAEALGFTNVRSLLDIPEAVDYVIVSVPNTVTPVIMKDAITKGVGGLHIYAAGFSETGAPEGAALEDRLHRMATEAGIPILGPNCLGIYHPKVGLRQSPDQPLGEGGAIGYLSQSGTLGTAFSMYATASGLKISKSVSFGNGRVVDCPDLLEYLAQDEETRLIGLYVEGLRDGRRFFQALRATAREKPVLVWKVGQTQESARAAQSHTGHRSPPEVIWAAMLRQCGATPADGLGEMVDTMKALAYLPPLGSDRVALLAVSGGHASEMAEAFARAGFRVPAVSDASFTEISSYASLAGGSFHNPFEGPSLREEANLLRTLDVIERDPNLDFVVMEIGLGTTPRSQAMLEARMVSVKKARERFHKPLCLMFSVANPMALVDVNQHAREALAEGMVAFWGPTRAARALYNAHLYYQQRRALYGEVA